VVSLKKGIVIILKIFIVRVPIAREEGGNIGKKESREETTELEKRISLSRWHKKNHLSLAPIIFPGCP
jgi:hypothetical protein